MLYWLMTFEWTFFYLDRWIIVTVIISRTLLLNWWLNLIKNFQLTESITLIDHLKKSLPSNQSITIAYNIQRSYVLCNTKLLLEFFAAETLFVEILISYWLEKMIKKRNCKKLGIVMPWKHTVRSHHNPKSSSLANNSRVTISPATLEKVKIVSTTRKYFISLFQ